MLRYQASWSIDFQSGFCETLKYGWCSHRMGDNQVYVCYKRKLRETNALVNWMSSGNPPPPPSYSTVGANWDGTCRSNDTLFSFSQVLVEWISRLPVQRSKVRIPTRLVHMETGDKSRSPAKFLYRCNLVSKKPTADDH